MDADRARAAEEHAAELACLVVHPDFRGRDSGERLLEAMEILVGLVAELAPAGIVTS